MLYIVYVVKRKYDSIVEYTVHLTAERDTVVSQLDEAQKELNREKQKKKIDNKNITKTIDTNNFQHVSCHTFKYPFFCFDYFNLFNLSLKCRV